MVCCWIAPYNTPFIKKQLFTSRLGEKKREMKALLGKLRRIFDQGGDIVLISLDVGFKDGNGLIFVSAVPDEGHRRRIGKADERRANIFLFLPHADEVS
jgi:hypothetical protein